MTKNTVNTVEKDARRILDWVENTPNENINSVETLNLALDVLEHPSDLSKACLRSIWEQRKPSTYTLCQATDDDVYTQLMEGLIYADEAPVGVLEKENRKYIQYVFGINVYTRIAEPEGRQIVFDNHSEMLNIIGMQRKSHSTQMDPNIRKYTDIMVNEIAYAYKNNKFVNLSGNSPKLN